MLELLYKKDRKVIEGRLHMDGSKKKWYDYSVDQTIDLFDGHKCEIVSYVVLSNIYHKEYPGLPPHDGKDPRGLSFARYVIWSCELCRLKDYEMIDFFFRCLLQKPHVEPDFFMNVGMLRAMFAAIHKGFTTNTHMNFLVEYLPHNDNGMKYSDLMLHAFKYPPIFYPILEFQRAWRRKLFGENWWGPKLFDKFARPAEYEDARSKFGIPSSDFNLFARVQTMKKAWKVACQNISLDILAGMSRTGTPPPWEKVEREVIAKQLKAIFGYQLAYFFLETMEIEEPHMLAIKADVDTKSLEKGERLHDNFFKFPFFYNIINGRSTWDEDYDEGRAQEMERVELAAELERLRLENEEGEEGDGKKKKKKKHGKKKKVRMADEDEADVEGGANVVLCPPTDEALAEDASKLVDG